MSSKAVESSLTLLLSLYGTCSFSLLSTISLQGWNFKKFVYNYQICKCHNPPNVIFHQRHNFTFRLKRRYAPTSIQQKPIMHTVELMTRFLDRMRDISSSSLTPNNLVSVSCLSLIFTSEDNHIQLLSVTSINY